MCQEFLRVEGRAQQWPRIAAWVPGPVLSSWSHEWPSLRLCARSHPACLLTKGHSSDISLPLLCHPFLCTQEHAKILPFLEKNPWPQFLHSQSPCLCSLVC